VGSPEFFRNSGSEAGGWHWLHKRQDHGGGGANRDCAHEGGKKEAVAAKYELGGKKRVGER